ncbi:Fic/DOC family protein [Desulfosporosinus fructosivorans]|nr:Fic family protein [Desulfosporosinus fructosivorans]
MVMMRDPYLYPNTEVLKNKLRVLDNEKLNTIEAEYTSTRLKEIMENPIKGNFDFDHLCRMHGYIFQDLYDWAGQPRIINIEKSEPVLGGISIEYSDFQDIKFVTSCVLSKMEEVDWERFSLDEKAESLSKYMAELWKVHIFREGNTRTIVTFICQYTERKGFKLDTELFEQNSAYVRSALVAASAVFKGLGDKSKPQYLVKIVKDALKRGESGIIE